MKKPINMIDLMNLAWDRKTTCSVEDYEIKIKNLLSHAYVAYSKTYKTYCENQGDEYDDEVFYAFQRVMVAIMLVDGDFLQGEYDAYVRMCDFANFEELTVSQCRECYESWSSEDIVSRLAMLVSLRDTLEDPDDYEAMVQGFCYLSLCGDREIDEDEFYILKCFFESGVDYCPSTWEQFKKEW